MGCSACPARYYQYCTSGWQIHGDKGCGFMGCQLECKQCIKWDYGCGCDSGGACLQNMSEHSTKCWGQEGKSDDHCAGNMECARYGHDGRNWGGCISDGVPGPPYNKHCCTVPGFYVKTGSQYCHVDERGCISDGVNGYGNDEDCTFEFRGDAVLVAEEWDIENHHTCGYDYLKVDGVKMCNKDSAYSQLVAGTTQFVWHTDVSVPGQGFKICVTEWN